MVRKIWFWKCVLFFLFYGKNDVSVFVKHAACTAHISLLYLELRAISQQPNSGFFWTLSGAAHQALGYFQAVEMQLGWSCWAHTGQGQQILNPAISPASVKTKIPHPTLGVMDGGFTPSNQELEKSKLILSLFLLFCFIFQPSSTSALLKFRIIIQFISLITCVLLSSFPGSSLSVYF